MRRLLNARVEKKLRNALRGIFLPRDIDVGSDLRAIDEDGSVVRPDRPKRSGKGDRGGGHGGRKHEAGTAAANAASGYMRRRQGAASKS